MKAIKSHFNLLRVIFYPFFASPARGEGSTLSWPSWTLHLQTWGSIDGGHLTVSISVRLANFSIISQTSKGKFFINWAPFELISGAICLYLQGLRVRVVEGTLWTRYVGNNLFCEPLFFSLMVVLMLLTCMGYFVVDLGLDYAQFRAQVPWDS